MNVNMLVLLVTHYTVAPRDHFIIRVAYGWTFEHRLLGPSNHAGEEARPLPPDTSINIHALIPCIVNGHFYHAENSGAATRITHHNHAGAGRTKAPSLHLVSLPSSNTTVGKHKAGNAVVPSVELRLCRSAIELIGACYLNF